MSTEPGKTKREEEEPAVTQQLKRPVASLEPSPTDETLRSADTSGPSTKSAAATEASFLGNYAGLVEIGRGGMSIVYRAVQRDLGRTVAVKKLLAGGDADAELLTRFQNEAEAVAKLSHPNIVQIYQTGHTEQGPYFILEYVAGGTLRQKMAQGPLRPAEAAELIETIARAMAMAHAEGIIHRDLKPGNILLTKEGTPKIADFGLAKRLETPSVTRTGDIMGTPSYMAPEQAQGSSRQVTTAADVYALGAMLYEMLTGRTPHRGVDAMETVYQVLHDDPVTPRKLVGQIPVDLETICLKCLEKTPAKRYKSMESLAEDLRRFRAGEPILAKPTPAWERVRKWVHRYPGWAAVVAISVISAATIITGFAIYNQRIAREKAFAETQLKIAKGVIDKWCDMTLVEVKRSPQGLSDAQKQMAEFSISFYEHFAQVNGDRPELRLNVFQTKRLVGELQAMIGDREKAETTYARLRSELESSIASFPQDGAILAEAAVVANNQAILARELGKEEQAEQQYQYSLTAYDRALNLGFDEQETKKRRSRTTYNYALMLISKQNAVAERLLQDSLAMHRSFISAHPGEPDHHLDAAFALTGLARVEWDRGELEKASKHFENSLQELEIYAKDAKDDVTPYEFGATNHGNLSTLAMQMSDLARANTQMDLALSLIQQLTANYPAIPKYKEKLVDLLVQRANLRGSQGDNDGGLKSLRDAEEQITSLAERFPQQASYQARRLELNSSLAYLMEGANSQGETYANQHAAQLAKTESLAKKLLESGLLSREEVLHEKKWTLFRLQPKLAALLTSPEAGAAPAAP